MTLNSTLLQNSISSSVNSTSSLVDMQSSRYSSSLLANSSNAGGTRQQSPLSSDLPGPSGIGPMQHAPLVRISTFNLRLTKIFGRGINRIRIFQIVVRGRR
jgi:hypothetical protein